MKKTTAITKKFYEGLVQTQMKMQKALKKDMSLQLVNQVMPQPEKQGERPCTELKKCKDALLEMKPKRLLDSTVLESTYIENHTKRGPDGIIILLELKDPKGSRRKLLQLSIN